MRGRAGAAAWAYPEHASHACDLRDVPVQWLVEAGDTLLPAALPGVERRRRGILSDVGRSQRLQAR